LLDSNNNIDLEGELTRLQSYHDLLETFGGLELGLYEAECRSN